MPFSKGTLRKTLWWGGKKSGMFIGWSGQVDDLLILALDGPDTEPFRIKLVEATDWSYCELTAAQGTGHSEAWGRTARVVTQNPKDWQLVLMTMKRSIWLNTDFLFLNKTNRTNPTNKTKQKPQKTQTKNTSKARLEEQKLELYRCESVIFFVHMPWSSHNVDISAGS